MNRLLTAIFLLSCTTGSAEDTTWVKVHFLYGSKPLKQYSESESKWFGGVLGGHVGIEIDSNSILNFVPNEGLHWFAHKKLFRSRFALHSFHGFYSMFSGSADSVKKAIVYVPLTTAQKLALDSISQAYLQQTPYDYAFVGMRCGAAAYHILAQLGILPEYSYRRTHLKIFYPRKLRTPLFKKARENNWFIELAEGSSKRKWDRDK
ncbi:MAG: hypothetical protein ACKVOR_03835 [Flavobacteriales bacterium]